MSPQLDTFDVLNPATEEVITTIELADAAGVDAAVQRSRKAFESWRLVPQSERARLLRALCALVEADLDHLAELETANVGHPITSSRGTTANVLRTMQYFAGAPERMVGQQIPVDGGIDITFHEPLGVVGVITPWNFPLLIAVWGMMPALAAGNTVILKPAELTPLTTMRLGELATQAGFPENVVQVVNGAGPVAGQALLDHPQVAKIVFTGSTAVGQKVMSSAAKNLKRVTLELGGKSANIVFEDADVAAAAAAAPMGVFDNTGQDCCARSRLLVQRSILDEFLEQLTPAVHAVKVGDPQDPGTQVGPIVSAAQRDRVADFVLSDEIFTQGSAPSGKGFWFPPTVIRVEGMSNRAAAHEIFGPVVAVIPFDTEAEAIAIANDTTYGLAGSIWTRDIARALRTARAVEAGNLSINSNSAVRYQTPFGGMKHSGIGRELGPDAAYAFTETKNVFISLS